MVLGVCLRVLRHEQDAEDAYQATFLILAIDAKKIRQPDSLASWLYGVAYRTSMKARDRKHRRRECGLSEDLETKTNVLQEIEKQHLHHTIDEELTRLPKKYRDVVVHKFLENKSTQQVADSLGLSHGVVKGRIERAKKHLRHRLLLRGCSLGVALVSIHESQSVATAAVSRSLIEATSTAGMIHQAGHPLDGLVTADAISLASKEISTMVSSSVLKCGLAALLLLAILAGLGVKSPIVAQKVDELTILPDTAADAPDVTLFRLVSEQTSPLKQTASQADTTTVESQQAEYLGTILSASEASKNGLKSGTGEGTYRHWTRSTDDADWKIESDAKVKVSFDDGKYHLAFAYDRSSGGLSERFIVFEGNAVYTNSVSALRDPPRNSSIHIFSMARSSTGHVRPAQADFPWDISKLSTSHVDVNKLIDNLAKQERQPTCSSNGGNIVVEYRLGPKLRHRVILDCPRKYGYNASRKRIYRPDGVLATEQNLTWKKQGETWYVDSIRERFTLIGGQFFEGDRFIRWELKFNRFDPNAKVSPKLFTMAALNANPSSSILDHRPNAEKR